MDLLQNASTSSDSVRRKCEKNKRNDEIQRSNASSYVIIMSNKRRDLIRESCKTTVLVEYQIVFLPLYEIR